MRDEDTRWLGFKDTIKFLQSRHGPTEQMLSIYHRRDSYIERFLSGLILVPSRRLSDELTRPAFSFVPHDSTRRLVKYSKYHFLGSALCKLAGLTSVNESCYVDENGKQPHSENGLSLTRRRSKPRCGATSCKTTANITVSFPCGSLMLHVFPKDQSARSSSRRSGSMSREAASAIFTSSEKPLNTFEHACHLFL